MEDNLPLLPPKNISEWLTLNLKNRFGIPVYSTWSSDLTDFQSGSKSLPKEFIQVDYQAFFPVKTESGSIINYEKIFTLYIKYQGDLEELTDDLVEWLSGIEYFKTQKGEHSINVQGGQPDQDNNSNVMIIQLNISQF